MVMWRYPISIKLKAHTTPKTIILYFVQHPGAGGVFCFTDPDEKLGYAYAMNKHGFGMANERRELALRKALIRLPLKK